MRMSVMFVRGLLAEVGSRGLPSSVLLARCGIEAHRLDDLQDMLSVDELDLLCRESVALTADPLLGLALGASAPPNMLQVLGHLMLAQPTLRRAFAVLQRYAPLFCDGLGLRLVEYGQVATLRCAPSVQLGESTQLVAEFVMAMIKRMVALFLPASARPLHARFQHAAPADVDGYARLFACPLVFGHEVNELELPRHHLDVVQPHGDETMNNLLTADADRLLTRDAGKASTTERIRAILRYERDLSVIDLDRIARRLTISKRALRRRLNSERVSLTGLLDEARCLIALEELRRPQATIKDTVVRIGFSEPSAFHRAFRRWTGITPLQYMRGTSPRQRPNAGTTSRSALRADSRPRQTRLSDTRAEA